jgi:hypothetical protein
VGWLLSGVLALAAAPAAQADTIVLKSGRRITATNVVDEGDRVSYETPAGRLSIRKDLVERIERGGTSTWASGSGGTKDVAVEPPRFDHLEGYDDVARAAVHDGSIDRAYLTRLENEFQAGGTNTGSRIAVAHHAAARFELQKGNVEQAIGHYRRALTFSPEHLGLLLNVSYLHLRRSEYSAALEYLERARRVQPDSADVAKLTGWAYYGSNRIELAVKEWQRALSLRPDPDTQQALEKATRDKEAEREFKEGETRHFNLRYHGGAAPQLAKEILRVLENHFRTIESELNFTPPEAVGVILYTEQAFADVTRAPGWAGALNDGRIRVPVQGLTSMTPELSQTLMHELVHSFVHQKTRGRAPVWLNEGIAQWMEGQRSGDAAAVLVEVYQRRGYLPYRVLEGPFTQLPGNAVGYAYAWSLAAVEYIVRSNGMGDIERILDRINSEPSGEAAVRSVLRLSYSELEEETAKFLKSTYLRQ